VDEGSVAFVLLTMHASDAIYDEIRERPFAVPAGVCQSRPPVRIIGWLTEVAVNYTH